MPVYGLTVTFLRYFFFLSKLDKSLALKYKLLIPFKNVTGITSIIFLELGTALVKYTIQ